MLVGLSAASLLHGCFYLVPVPYAQPHPSPERVSVFPEPSTTVNLTTAGQAVLVVVQDDDPVSFIWALSRDGYVGTATPIPNDDPTIQGSQLHLDYDVGLDQQTLSCVISDGVSEAVTYTWQLEVL